MKCSFLNRRRTWLAAALVVVVAPFTPGAEATDAAKDLVRRFETLGSFRVDFTQRTYRDDGTLLEDAVGTFTFARPDRIRWEVEQPFPQVIVSDGHRAAVFDPDLGQLVVHEMRDHETSVREVLALTAEELTGLFEVRQEADTFTLIPLQGSELYSALSLHFSATVLVGITMNDKLGTVTEFGFLNMRPLGSLSASYFVIDVPPGTDIVGDPEGLVRKQVAPSE